MRELYFLGGFNSFAHQYRTRFPTSEDDHGDMILEVPVPMVALVATAVSAEIYIITLY
jgi:hypothetical protein